MCRAFCRAVSPQLLRTLPSIWRLSRSFVEGGKVLVGTGAAMLVLMVMHPDQLAVEVETVRVLVGGQVPGMGGAERPPSRVAGL
jgi:hypothetical protein